MQPHRIHAVVFDFFGVICPALSSLTGAKFSQRHGIDPVEFSRFGWRYRDDLDHGRMSQQEFATKLQQHFHVSSSPDQLNRELGELDGHFYAFDHRLHDLIINLKPRVTVALMSNVSRDEAAHLRQLGAYSVFDQVFISGDSGLTKSDPVWFDRLATELGCLPSQIILIDDSEANVATAKQAGWTKSVVYQNPAALIEYLASLGLKLA
jgi:HAD superfamily hydrolase (TIGR01509 family)